MTIIFREAKFLIKVFCNPNPKCQISLEMFAVLLNVRYLDPSLKQGVFHLPIISMKKELFKPILRIQRDPQVTTAQASASLFYLQLHCKKWITGVMPHS